MKIKELFEMAKMKAVRTYKIGSTGETVMPKIAKEIKQLLGDSFPDLEVEYFKDEKNPKVWYLGVSHSNLDSRLQLEADRRDAIIIASKHDEVINAEPDVVGTPSPGDRSLGVMPWFCIKVTCK